MDPVLPTFRRSQPGGRLTFVRTRGAWVRRRFALAFGLVLCAAGVPLLLIDGALARPFGWSDFAYGLLGIPVALLLGWILATLPRGDEIVLDGQLDRVTVDGRVRGALSQLETVEVTPSDEGARLVLAFRRGRRVAVPALAAAEALDMAREMAERARCRWRAPRALWDDRLGPPPPEVQ